MNNNKKTLGIKIFMFILTIGYIGLFTYEYINKGFPMNNENIIKTILLFSAILLCCISSITNSLATYFFTISNYIVIILLTTLSLNNILNLENKKIEKINKDIYISCFGSTDISDNTNIEITYTNDDIKKLIYTYKLPIEKIDGAHNLVNKFDQQYIEHDTIYSEITISNEITVKLTYNIENIEKNKKSNLDDSITSYNKLKNNTLNKMTCKSREN